MDTPIIGDAPPYAASRARAATRVHERAAGAGPRVDDRAAGALPHASSEVTTLWRTTAQVTAGDVPPAGLAAGERPAADVEVLASTMAAVEYELARRMHTARTAGALHLHDPGATLSARGWSLSTARRLDRCGALAAQHHTIASAWAAGLVTSEHLDPIARNADRFTTEELTALIAELHPHWGTWSPASIARFVHAADQLLHPPPDPTGDEADALVELVNTAHASGALPTRGGLPVALTVTLDHTALGDPVWTTSRGHHLTSAEARWAGCDAEITPILTATRACCGPGQPDHHTHQDDDSIDLRDRGHASPAGPAARIAALAALLFDTRIPLAVGRTRRTATLAQRRALAVRDRGCLIPGCAIPAEACQAHHLTEWGHGGGTDLPNLALLCWAHHRQVDLNMWTIQPGPPTGPNPQPGAPPGTPWPANHGAPFTITRTPRHRWRT